MPKHRDQPPGNFTIVSVPSDPVGRVDLAIQMYELLKGRKATAEDVRACRIKFGLPAHEQKDKR